LSQHLYGQYLRPNLDDHCIVFFLCLMLMLLTSATLNR
jgi:hypothetical protein